METIVIVMVLQRCSKVQRCIAWSAEIIDNLLGDTFAVQCPCHSYLCGVPLMNYDELMMAVDHRHPGHDNPNDGICAAKHSMMVIAIKYFNTPI